MTSFVETRAILAKCFRIKPEDVTDEDIYAYLRSGPGFRREDDENEALVNRLKNSPGIPLIREPQNKHIGKRAESDDTGPDSYYAQTVTKSEK